MTAWQSYVHAVLNQGQSDELWRGLRPGQARCEARRQCCLRRVRDLWLIESCAEGDARRVERWELPGEWN